MDKIIANKSNVKIIIGGFNPGKSFANALDGEQTQEKTITELTENLKKATDKLLNAIKELKQYYG